MFLTLLTLKTGFKVARFQKIVRVSGFFETFETL